MSEFDIDYKKLFPSKSIGTLNILFAILGYFLYGGLKGALGVLAISISLSFLTYIGLIPVLGVFLYVVLAKTWIMPYLFNLAELQATWLTGLIFWIGLAISIAYTAIITLALLAVFWGLK